LARLKGEAFSHLTEALRILRHEGFTAETFTSAPAFFARQCTWAPSCPVLDVSLPGLAARLRLARPSPIHLPLAK
jgi:FixJ family two-component response regulator